MLVRINGFKFMVFSFPHVDRGLFGAMTSAVLYNQKQVKCSCSHFVYKLIFKNVFVIYNVICHFTFRTTFDFINR
jgi:hypothetical protein